MLPGSLRLRFWLSRLLLFTMALAIVPLVLLLVPMFVFVLAVLLWRRRVWGSVSGGRGGGGGGSTE
ncbi:hypothetical protein BJX76DRAFT_318499 [Aspergillus varians]